MSVKVLRAVPGAGKSTYAKKLKLDATSSVEPGGIRKMLLDAPNVHILSTDDFFMVDGTYQFNVQKLGEAHQATQRKFLKLVQDDPKALIIVDNTNTSIAEFGWYVTTGILFGHEVEIVTLLVDAAVAAARNVHGVPQDRVLGMDRRLREETDRIPPFWSSKVVYL